jgi:hypothetical protein
MEHLGITTHFYVVADVDVVFAVIAYKEVELVWMK